MYKIENYESEISVQEYIERFVDVETFLEACKQCPNYKQVWSCPEYDFDVLSYWKKYQTLKVYAHKIIFEPEYQEKVYEQDELNAILQKVLKTEKQKLSDRMMEEEKKYPGSISLSAGSCGLCKDGCTRPHGKACRFPDKMRYSIESLGGNVGMTIEKLMGLELEWMEEGKLPTHFILVNGLLM